MKCELFTKLVPNFIDDNLEVEIYDEFLEHVRECPDCREELEIHYMITVGFDRIENDSTKSFNIQGQLENQLASYEMKADSVFKKKIYRNMLIALAESCGLIMAVVQLFMVLK